MNQKGLLTTLLFSATILHPSYQRNNPLTQALTQFSGALSTLTQRLGQRATYQPPNTYSEPFENNPSQRTSIKHPSFTVVINLDPAATIITEDNKRLTLTPDKKSPTITGLSQVAIDELAKNRPRYITATNIRPIQINEVRNWNDTLTQNNYFTPWQATINLDLLAAENQRLNVFLGNTTKTNTLAITRQKIAVESYTVYTEPTENIQGGIIYKVQQETSSQKQPTTSQQQAQPNRNQNTLEQKVKVFAKLTVIYPDNSTHYLGDILLGEATTQQSDAALVGILKKEYEKAHSNNNIVLVKDIYSEKGEFSIYLDTSTMAENIPLIKNIEINTSDKKNKNPYRIYNQQLNNINSLRNYIKRTSFFMGLPLTIEFKVERVN